MKLQFTGLLSICLLLGSCSGQTSSTTSGSLPSGTTPASSTEFFSTSSTKKVDGIPVTTNTTICNGAPGTTLANCINGN